MSKGMPGSAKPTNTVRIPTEAWNKSKLLGITLSQVQGEVVTAAEANRRAVEFAFRNIDLIKQDAEMRRRLSR